MGIAVEIECTRYMRVFIRPGDRQSVRSAPRDRFKDDKMRIQPVADILEIKILLNDFKIAMQGEGMNPIVDDINQER